MEADVTGAPRPVISILTPTHNRSTSFLPQAIASVRALRLSVRFEHVIVDDGSTDGTAAYLAQEAARDSRIRWTRHTTARGVAAYAAVPAQASCKRVGSVRGYV